LLEALGQSGSIEVSADEHEVARARRVPPWAILASVEEHMDALEYKPLVTPLDVQDSLHAKNIGPLLAQKLGDPLIEPLAVDRALEVDAYGRDFVVVRVTSSELLLAQRHKHGFAAADAKREL
jgi:hypothetical protein